MTDIRYLAPGTLDEAIKAFAAAGSAARILAGGTDLLVQMRSGAREAGRDRRHQENRRDDRASRRPPTAAFASAPPSPARCWREHPQLRQGLARRARGRQPDRLDPGPGPRLARAAICATARRPATACRRWSRPAPSSRCRARTAAARCRSRSVPAGPGRTNLQPGEILVSFTLPPRPPGSGDAYLRMIPRTEMDIAVVGVRRQPHARRTASAPPRASASARWRRPCCWSRTPPRR